VPSPYVWADLMISDSYREGQILHGRYEIVRMIKSTGLSQVYLGKDTESDENVIIKLPAYEGNSRSNTIKAERLQVEAAVLRALNHPYVVRYVDSWGYGADFHIVSEYVNARSMNERFSSKMPSTNEAVEYVLELLEALDYVHGRGVVHRDVKPSNILMCDSIVLLDFGASVAGFLSPKYRSVKMGTPGYQCPELFKEPVTPQCDIYSVGATMLFLLSGEKPSPRSSAADSSIETGLAEVIRRAMSKKLSERFREASDMKKALKEAVQKVNGPRIVVGENHYEIDQEKIVIGRGRGADVRINDSDKYVSPVHAEVCVDDEGEIWIVDKSLNGTFVYHNEKYRKIERWCLLDGDIIVLCYTERKGPHKILKFRSGSHTQI